MTIYIITAIFIICMAFLYRKVALRYHIFDVPNFRSSHTKPVIRGAGIVFYIAFLWSQFFFNQQNVFLIFGVSLLAIISFIDDIKSLPAWPRLGFQMVGLTSMFFEFPLSFALFLSVVLISIVIINFYNFIDGINGMLALYSFITVGSLYVVSLVYNIAEFKNLLLIIGVSIVVFAFFNFRKNAVFFAGDVGSITLGAILLFIIISLSFQLKSPIILGLLTVCVADTGLTLIKRIKQKKAILQAHREHVYEQLTDKSRFSHLQISSLYGVLQLIINTIVVFTIPLTINYQLFILLVLSLVSCILYFYCNRWLQKI
ncbi:hypothetical protein ACG2LH_08625 [Zhouia sp. PK063]|uniref:hypothetical protein n=1 Tax=Zhouia sp. PK063 TaxID=3373602 RepID=UPI0037B85526